MPRYVAIPPTMFLFLFFLCFSLAAVDPGNCGDYRLGVHQYERSIDAHAVSLFFPFLRLRSTQHGQARRIRGRDRRDLSQGLEKSGTCVRGGAKGDGVGVGGGRRGSADGLGGCRLVAGRHQAHFTHCSALSRRDTYTCTQQ